MRASGLNGGAIIKKKEDLVRGRGMVQALMSGELRKEREERKLMGLGCRACTSLGMRVIA